GAIKGIAGPSAVTLLELSCALACPLLQSLVLTPKNMSEKTRIRIDERYRVQASACGGCRHRVVTGGRIGAGANPRRNRAPRDRRMRQYTSSGNYRLEPRTPPRLS